MGVCYLCDCVFVVGYLFCFQVFYDCWLVYFCFLEQCYNKYFFFMYNVLRGVLVVSGRVLGIGWLGYGFCILLVYFLERLRDVCFFSCVWSFCFCVLVSVRSWFVYLFISLFGRFSCVRYCFRCQRYNLKILFLFFRGFYFGGGKIDDKFENIFVKRQLSIMRCVVGRQGVGVGVRCCFYLGVWRWEIFLRR